jgi:hypothetical protein
MKTLSLKSIRRMLCALTLVMTLSASTAALADAHGFSGKGGQETGGIVRSSTVPVDFSGKGGQETGG